MLLQKRNGIASRPCLSKWSSRDAFARGALSTAAQVRKLQRRIGCAARTFQFPCARCCCCFKYGSPSTNDKGFFLVRTTLLWDPGMSASRESPRRKLVAFHVFLSRAPFSAPQILDLVCWPRRNVITFSYLGSAMSHELVDKFSFVEAVRSLTAASNTRTGLVWGSCLDFADISLARL